MNGNLLNLLIDLFEAMCFSLSQLRYTIISALRLDISINYSVRSMIESELMEIGFGDQPQEF